MSSHADPAPGMKSEWTAMSYQEKLTGNSAYLVFALAMLLVYLVLAGQYGSWVTPAAVIFGVPLALLGTGGALLALGDRQQPLHADWPRTAHRAFGQERDPDRGGGPRDARRRARASPRPRWRRRTSASARSS